MGAVTKVGSKVVNDVELEVWASEAGEFMLYATDGDDEKEEYGRGPSLNAAVGKARVLINRRKTKVDVPFKTSDGKSGVAHGERAGRRRGVLATVDGRPEEFGPYENVLRADTPDEEIRRMGTLLADSRKLKAEYDALIVRYQLDLGRAVKRAVTEASGEASS